MYEYIQGRIAELTPAYVVIDNGGIGYMILISLNTYTALSGKEQAIIFLHHIVREDAQLFYGFASKNEREVFRLLLTVSGVGPNTATFSDSLQECRRRFTARPSPSTATNAQKHSLCQNSTALKVSVTRPKKRFSTNSKPLTQCAPHRSRRSKRLSATPRPNW